MTQSLVIRTEYFFLNLLTCLKLNRSYFIIIISNQKFNYFI